VNIWPVDCERAFVFPDDHRHLSVHRVFLRYDNEYGDGRVNDGGTTIRNGIPTLYAAVKSCEVLKSRSDASDMRLKIDAVFSFHHHHHNDKTWSDYV
jgi:mannose-6-phosphate isomerase-like protein (cupin superfamily)